jgi:hypothetical protein
MEFDNIEWLEAFQNASGKKTEHHGVQGVRKERI